MKKSHRSLLIKIAGSLLILYVLFRLIDFDGEAFTAVLKDLHTGYYLLSLAGVVVVLAIKSFRWHRIIKNEGHNYPPLKAFGAYMASFTIGVITPGRIGEIARLYYLRQSCELSFLPAFRTIVTDRIYDLGVLIMLGMAALLHFSGLDGGNAYLAVLAGVVLFFVALFLGVFLLKILLKSAAFGQFGFFQFVRDSLLQAVDHRALPLWLITLAAYLAFYLAIDLIFLSLGIDIRIVDIALVLSVVGLATILPISWAGFGTREISLVYLLAFYDIPAEVALSFSLLQFGAFFLWGSLIGLVFWLLMPITMEQIKTDSQALKALLKGSKNKTV
jgi:glycosyltransferase 2 family protein